MWCRRSSASALSKTNFRVETPEGLRLHRTHYAIVGYGSLREQFSSESKVNTGWGFTVDT